jgi:YihY family inner membrane protein
VATKTRDLKALVHDWVELFAEHDLLTYASAIARQCAIALIPLVLLGLGLLGASGRTDVWDNQIAPQLQARFLPAVYAGIEQTAQKIFATNSAGLIAFAALYSTWAISGVVRACMGALTRIYDTDEKRSWKVRFPISFGLAVVLMVSLLGAILLIVAGKHWGSGAAHAPVTVLRWVAALVLVDLGFDLLVRFAPAEPRAKKWATAGATLVVVSWVVESLIFRWYITSVANFHTAIGSLTVFLVLMAYLYTGSIILLVGMELDELLRKDLQRGEDEKHILEHVRALF